MNKGRGRRGDDNPNGCRGRVLDEESEGARPHRTPVDNHLDPFGRLCPRVPF